MIPSWHDLDAVYTSTDPNGESVPKLAEIGLPFTLDLWIRTHLGLLSATIWDRCIIFPYPKQQKISQAK